VLDVIFVSEAASVLASPAERIATNVLPKNRYGSLNSPNGVKVFP
jgi:hypothetical protein